MTVVGVAAVVLVPVSFFHHYKRGVGCRGMVVLGRAPVTVLEVTGMTVPLWVLQGILVLATTKDVVVVVATTRSLELLAASHFLQECIDLLLLWEDFVFWPFPVLLDVFLMVSLLAVLPAKSRVFLSRVL